MRKPVVVLAEPAGPSDRRLAAALTRLGLEVRVCRMPVEASVLDGPQPDLVVLGSGGNPAAVAEELTSLAGGAPVLMAIQPEAERWPAGIPVSPGDPLRGMVGESPPMQLVRRAVSSLARTDSTVLITGETGTGKELAAELIHGGSRRRAGPFVCINCAAIPDGLLESELFGFEKGAFTGAHAAYEGRLTLARGGTVFLDEVGDMSPYGQAKILRVLESREVHRLGGRRGVALDVRVIAATNGDLETLVAEGRFRRDLYYRLNVARIRLPALRERPEDVPALVEHLIRELNTRLGARVTGIEQDALDALAAHDWPGNVRELRNLLEAAMLQSRDATLRLGSFPETLRGRAPHPASPRDPEEERRRVLSALEDTRWNKSQAAARLHWSRMTLYRKMARYQITLKPGEAPPREAPALSAPQAS
jgi:two-component system response regulator HydG/two-component system response regulator AtoC